MKYYKSERINQLDFSKKEMWYILFIKEIPYPLQSPDSPTDVMWWLGVLFSPTYAGTMSKTNPDSWVECSEEEFIKNAELFSADRITSTHKNANRILQAKTEKGKKSIPDTGD